MKVKNTMSGSEAVWKFEFWNSKLDSGALELIDLPPKLCLFTE